MTSSLRYEVIAKKLYRSEKHRMREAQHALCGEGLHELDDAAFRPAPIVSISFCEKRAVTAILRFLKFDVGVRGYFVACLRGDTYEGIIRRVHDQGWHGDPIHYS